MENITIQQSEGPPQAPSTHPCEEWEEGDTAQAEGEEKNAEEEEGKGTVEGGRVVGGGYACRICGFHAGDVRGLSQHLHTVHPVTSLAPLSACETEPAAKERAPSPRAMDGEQAVGAGSEEAGAKESRSPGSTQRCPPIPNGMPHLPAGHPVTSSQISEAGGSFGHNHTPVVCLPLVAEGLKLVWTRSDQTQELDHVPELLQAFNAFPYPTLQEVGALSRRCALPVDTVKVWFMVQRIRYGISWASEEIEETRSKLGGLHLRQQRQQEEEDEEEDEEDDEEDEDEMCTYPPESWGNGAERCEFDIHVDDGHSGLRSSLAYRRHRPFLLSRGPLGRRPLGRLRGLDVAPSPLFVVAPPPRGRKSKAQLRALRRSFVRDNWLSEMELRRLQAETGLTRGEVRKWFSDSRYQLRNNGHRPPQGPGQGVIQGGMIQGGVVGNHTIMDLEDSSFTESLSSGLEEDQPVATGGPAEKLGKAMKEEEEEEPATEKDPLLFISDSGETVTTVSSSLSSTMLTSTGRLRKTKEQLAVLKQFFLRCQWPTSEDYTRLVEWTGLPRADVIQWFGDARYRVKNGNLRWVRGEREHQQIMAEITQNDRGSGPGRGRRRIQENGGEGTEVTTPPPNSSRGGSDSLGTEPGAETGAEKVRSGGGTGNSGTDIRPLEMYWRQTGALQEKDLDTLCRKAGMAPQQVRDWFTFQESGMAEVEVNISD